MACMWCGRWEELEKVIRQLIKTAFFSYSGKNYLILDEHCNHLAKKTIKPPKVCFHSRTTVCIKACKMPTQAWEGSVTWEVKVTGSVLYLRDGSMSSWLCPYSCLPSHFLLLFSGPGHYSQCQHGQYEWQSCVVCTQTPVSLQAGRQDASPENCVAK